MPSFPEVRRDAGYECGNYDGGSYGTCAAGEVCLQGFCYARCSESQPCGPLEECSAEGVCVLRTSDAGAPVDAGPPGPCDFVSCTDPTPYCRAGVCLACETRNDCTSALAPVCDLASGTCTQFNLAGLCAACNADDECMAIDASLRCLTRSVPTERVCVPTCDSGCPQGFECDAATTLCVPRLGGSCTAVRRTIDGASCEDGAGEASDAACVPVGASEGTGLFVGACFDDFVRGGFTCHVPCTGDDDCPVGTGTCDLGIGFCHH